MMRTETAPTGTKLQSVTQYQRTRSGVCFGVATTGARGPSRLELSFDRQSTDIIERKTKEAALRVAPTKCSASTVEQPSLLPTISEEEFDTAHLLGFYTSATQNPVNEWCVAESGFPQEAQNSCDTNMTGRRP